MDNFRKGEHDHLARQGLTPANVRAGHQVVSQHKQGGGNFIAGAIKHPGALTAKAKAAGEGTQEFAREHAHDPGTTGSQARFDLFLNKVRPGKK